MVPHDGVPRRAQGVLGSSSRSPLLAAQVHGSCLPLGWGRQPSQLWVSNTDPGEQVEKNPKISAHTAVRLGL